MVFIAPEKIEFILSYFKALSRNLLFMRAPVGYSYLIAMKSFVCNALYVHARSTSTPTACITGAWLAGVPSVDVRRFVAPASSTPSEPRRTQTPS